MTPNTICIETLLIPTNSEGMIIKSEEIHPYVMGMQDMRDCPLPINNGIIMARKLNSTPHIGIKNTDATNDWLFHVSNP